MNKVMYGILAICAGFGGSVGGALLFSPATEARAADPPGFSRQVRANMFVLVDKKGRTRGEWAVEPKMGMAVLRMSGTDEKGRLAVSCLQDGTPMIAFLNANGKMALQLSADSKHGTQLRLFAPDGVKTRLLMQVTEGVKKPGLQVGVGGLIVAYGETGGSAGLFALKKSAGIGILDKDEKAIWSAP